MSASTSGEPGKISLRLPATSANLGPGFDAVAVALDFYLEIDAEPASDFSIVATGRNAERCARIEDNLILEAYKRLLRANQREIVPLAIKMRNQIPLGMGCGSSAAGRLAAIILANHFGQLDLNAEAVLDEAYMLEGHPDNVAACWLGGFVASICEGRRVYPGHVTPPQDWRVIVAIPAEPLPTSVARSVLPASYWLQDVVQNLQSLSLLGLAFERGRGDLLRLAMQDKIHQPYRAAICPLLPLLLPLAGEHGILAASLSGAGPSVLTIVENESSLPAAEAAIRHALGAHENVELLRSKFVSQGAKDISQTTGFLSEK
jgi:homoserine kinase